jgi:dCTP deaminase
MVYITKIKRNLMILTKLEIIKQLNKKNISISPYSEELLNPNSYNYRLNTELIEFDNSLDAKERNSYKKINIPPEGYVLQPNKLYLASTYEQTGSRKFVTQLIGRSSIGRLGLFLQITAPLGHIGTYHNWTLELKVVQPLRVYPLMKIGQVSFWKTKGKTQHTYNDGEYKKYHSAEISKFYKELQ